MPIVVGEFDIMTEQAEPPKSRGASPEEQEQQQAGPRLRPEQITQVARVNRERMERVRAD